MSIDSEINRERILNYRLSKFLKENGIKRLRLTSIGNSIASGYSMVRKTKPLLLRNKSIKKYMKKNGIDVDIHHFARAQNNSDEHIFEWLESNIKESEIHVLNRNDYSMGETSIPTPGITDEKIDKYYPTKMKKDYRFKDTILESGKDLANIVVYNGCTGSFLDGITRSGSLFQQMFYGVNRDISSIDSILKIIQHNNRKNGSNTQVYLCGAPNFLGLNASELINYKLRKLAKRYSNVVYVKPVSTKFVYQPLDRCRDGELSKIQSFLKVHSGIVDIHYDEEEYLRFNNNIIKTIKDNYEITQSMINIDRKFYDLSTDIELVNHELIDSKEKEKMLSNLISSECDKIEGLNVRKQFLTKLKQYFIERLPYDFYYLGKEKILEKLNIKSK